MLNKKEIIIISIISIILAFTISLIQSTQLFLSVLAAIFLVILVNTIAKKITGYYFEAEVETKLWEIERYGIIGILTKGLYKHPSHKLKQPLPIGAILPIIIKVISAGYLNWMASLVFDVKAKPYRSAKRHGFYSFTEMTEFHIGLIAAAGIVANLFFGIIGYLIGATEFAKLNIYYAFFNMIPFSNLDGNKIFFGSLIIWSFLASIVLIGIGFAFLII